MLKREWDAESNGKLPLLFIPSKTATWVPEFAVKDLSLGRTHWRKLYIWKRRVIGISGSPVWSKTLTELIFNPRGEFRWSLESSVSQIHSPHLHIGAIGIFQIFLRSVKMLKREWDAESNVKLSYLFIPSKTNLGSWVCNGRPAFGQNCNLDFCSYNERPALGQDNLMMMMIL